jgi:hypothetical protein
LRRDAGVVSHAVLTGSSWGEQRKYRGATTDEHVRALARWLWWLPSQGPRLRRKGQRRCYVTESARDVHIVDYPLGRVVSEDRLRGIYAPNGISPSAPK